MSLSVCVSVYVSVLALASAQSDKSSRAAGRASDRIQLRQRQSGLATRIGLAMATMAAAAACVIC